MVDLTMTNREEFESECSEEEEDKIGKWIPDYLRRYVAPYHDEFCYTLIYHRRLLAALMMEGFLPIAADDFILPKLHHERSVISLPEGLHVSKSARKKSKRFRLTVNQSFDRVVEGCHEQHGELCWLYPELVRVFKDINEAGQVDCVVHPTTSILSSQTQETAPVRMYSIEVWTKETGELAAGELGYTVGSVYTSLTGFSAHDSAGSVQLASLGRLLSKLGFKLWDLGMDMEYKRGLGSHAMKRKDFVSFITNTRVTDGNIVIPTTNSVGFNCKSLVDQTLSLETICAGGEPIQTTAAKPDIRTINIQECSNDRDASDSQSVSSPPIERMRLSIPM